MDDDVMDDFAISGLNFERSDEVVFGEVRWDDETAVNIRTFGRKLVVFVRFENDVWFAEGLRFRENCGAGGRSADFPSGVFGVGPFFEQGDLFGRLNGGRRGEFAEARLGLPRRHVFFLAGDAGDLFGVFADIAIVEEGKRGRLRQGDGRRRSS